MEEWVDEREEMQEVEREMAAAASMWLADASCGPRDKRGDTHSFSSPFHRRVMRSIESLHIRVKAACKPLAHSGVGWPRRTAFLGSRL